MSSFYLVPDRIGNCPTNAAWYRVQLRPNADGTTHTVMHMPAVDDLLREMWIVEFTGGEFSLPAYDLRVGTQYPERYVVQSWDAATRTVVTADRFTYLDVLTDTRDWEIPGLEPLTPRGQHIHPDDMHIPMSWRPTYAHT